MLGGITLTIEHEGVEYSQVLELSSGLQAALVIGGLLCLTIVIYSLVRMERAQDRIIEMKLRSDEEAEDILRYEYQDYRSEPDFRFALSPILMVISLIVTGIALTLWMNEVILEPSTAALAFYFGILLGWLSVGDQFYLWIRSRRQRTREGTKEVTR
jgi:hypothetical protein